MFLKYHISSSEKEAICSLAFLSTFLLTDKTYPHQCLSERAKL